MKEERKVAVIDCFSFVFVKGSVGDRSSQLPCKFNNSTSLKTASNISDAHFYYDDPARCEQWAFYLDFF